jgi:hypothetical protein
MKEEERMMKDDFLREMLQEKIAPVPSAEFTANVMRAVEAEAARLRLLTAPLISRRVWQRLGLAIGLILLFPLLIGLISSNRWSELSQALTTFPLPQNIKLAAAEISAQVIYLPKLAVITASCLIILLLDKLCQRLLSK